MSKYFSVYVPNSYFIFYNQDSTKIDSMYITAYDSTVLMPKEPFCIKSTNYSFTLNSKYLSTDKQVQLKIQSSPFNSDFYFFGGSSPSGDRGWGFGAKEGADTFYISTSNPPVILNRIMFYQLWNNPQYTVVEVTPYYHPGQGTVYFSPQTGIIKYITNDLKDSFTLVKIYTP